MAVAVRYVAIGSKAFPYSGSLPFIERAPFKVLSLYSYGADSFIFVYIDT